MAKTSVRITITIPIALRKEILKYKNKVNWSQIATEAIKIKIAELERTKCPHCGK